MNKFVTLVIYLGLCIKSGISEPADVDWYSLGKESLSKLQKQKPAIRRAKNVILFIGDGMGISTNTAARLYKGELRGNKGPEENLVYESFPHTALSKTYTHNHQVADSAASATAIVTGVKTDNGKIGVTHHQPKGNCINMAENSVDSIFRWSQIAGKATGVVSTARITHATPASAYAQISHRHFEGNLGDDHEENLEEGCIDIAMQLVDGPTGKDLNVILGGGLRNFIPQNDTGSRRVDDLDLVEHWKDVKSNTGRPYAYVTNRTQLMEVDPENTDYLFGLFSNSHMTFELERNKDLQPSLEEMAEVAIKSLQKDDDGFILMIEGGRIDHAHHASRAKAALEETLAFDKAVQKALDLTSADDTLIIVTADHSHVFTFGHEAPPRGSGKSILGVVDISVSGHVPTDGKANTALSYANGPGGLLPGYNRTDPANETTDADDYVFQSLVPMSSETHGGEDVGIYATGPMSHLFRGVMEQNVIAHIMAHASCVGEYSDCSWSTCGVAARQTSIITIVLLSVLVLTL